ncbi:hypothetical protein PANT_7d00108 [Moesziomyces antarcticus T-34]|uniref:Uncharacterized protein n=1 Tax=Pseudozyma antarctica (strain T-34) TaxID=1151754 RepID=M9LU04_PSEA3|nr:hypothetical protein PANT_7d00108 [Moesziomyces antarcticus T-34]
MPSQTGRTGRISSLAKPARPLALRPLTGNSAAATGLVRASRTQPSCAGGDTASRHFPASSLQRAPVGRAAEQARWRSPAQPRFRSRRLAPPGQFTRRCTRTESVVLSAARRRAVPLRCSTLSKRVHFFAGVAQSSALAHHPPRSHHLGRLRFEQQPRLSLHRSVNFTHTAMAILAVRSRSTPL